MKTWGLVLCALVVACGDDDMSGDSGALMDAATLDGAMRDGALPDGHTPDGGGDAPDFDAGGDAQPDGASDAGDVGPMGAPGDMDGDGVADEDDAFPEDPAEFADSDGDGVGNFADADEDGDGVPDDVDAYPFDNSISDIVEYAEMEPNDAPAGQRVGGAEVTLPFRITGSLGPADMERFSFVLPPGSPPVGVFIDGPENLLIQASQATELGKTRPIGGGPGHATFSVDGDLPFVLAIADVSGRRFFAQRPYTITVFADGDRDGIDDDRELALGMSPSLIDMDGDGLWPLEELTPPFDGDADGLANWLDADSDGDGARDEFEDAGDPDFDDIPSFLDTDADGDGEGDGASVSPMGHPIDGDGDEVFDFMDTDDDGDGIPDTLDASDEVAPAVTPIDSGVPQIARAYGAVAGAELERYARVGDTIVLEGVGFSAGAQVIFETERGPRVVPADSATATEVRVQVPDVVLPEGGAIRVFAGGAMGANFQVDIQPASAPILDGAVMNVPAGTGVLSFTGSGLAETDAAIMGSLPLNVRSRGETTVQVQTPQLTGGSFRVRRGDAWSNAVRVQVLYGLTIRPALPAGFSVAQGDLRFASAAQSDLRVAGTTGFLDVPHPAPSIVTGVYPGMPDDSVVLQAVRVPGDITLDMDVRSTIVARIFMAAVDVSRYPNYILAEIRDGIAALPEVATAEATLSAALIADPRFLDAPTAAFHVDLDAAINAAGAVLTPYADVVRRPHSMISRVDPPMVGGITVTETSGERPNIEVDNDTQVYLSVEVRLDANDEVVVPHVNGALSGSIVGTQWGVLGGFLSERVTFDEPRGRNATVEVIGGGFSDVGLDEDDARVHRYLLIRTAFDKIALPIFAFAVGQVFDAHRVSDIFINLITQNATQQVQALIAAADTGEPRTVLSALTDLIINDLQNLGALTRAATLGAADPRAIAQRVIVNVVPAFAFAKRVLDAGEAIVTSINIGAAVNDMLVTPSRTVFTVSQQFSVTDRAPAWMFREDLLLDPFITIYGRQFTAVRNDAGDLDYPRLIVTTPGLSNRETLRPRHVEHDEITFRAQEEQLLFGQNQLTLELITAEGEDPIPVDPIEITDELHLGSLRPGRACTGRQVRLTGTRFSSRPSENQIILTGLDSGTVINVTPISASSTDLIFVTPPGLRGEPDWSLQLRVGPVGATVLAPETLSFGGCGGPVPGRWVAVSEPYDADDYPAFNTTTQSCGLLPLGFGERSYLQGIHLMADGVAAVLDCGDESVSNRRSCDQRLGQARIPQDFWGTWTQSGDVVTINVGIECNRPNVRSSDRWQLQVVEEGEGIVMRGTSISSCASSWCWHQPFDYRYDVSRR